MAAELQARDEMQLLVTSAKQQLAEQSQQIREAIVEQTRSAMLDRQELHQQMRDAMQQMREAMVEQNQQLRTVLQPLNIDATNMQNFDALQQAMAEQSRQAQEAIAEQSRKMQEAMVDQSQQLREVL